MMNAFEPSLLRFNSLLADLRSLSYDDWLYGPEGFDLYVGGRFLKQNADLLYCGFLLYLPLCELFKSLAPFPNFDPKQPGAYPLKARLFHRFMECVCTVWNFFLAAFSITGAYYFLRFAYTGLIELQCPLEALLTEQCQDTAGKFLSIRTDKTISWWAILFVLSKLVEFGDTFLYCFQKGKDHLFLHWWHHQVTGMYSLYRIVDAPKFTIVPMILNFTVHAVMYSYYTLTSLQKTNLMPGFVNRLLAFICNTINIFITAMQLSQMLIALYAFPYYATVVEPEFGFDLLGVLMYLIYAIYFASLFLGKYIFKTHKAAKSTDKSVKPKSL